MQNSLNKNKQKCKIEEQQKKNIGQKIIEKKKKKQI